MKSVGLFGCQTLSYDSAGPVVEPMRTPRESQCEICGWFVRLFKHSLKQEGHTQGATSQGSHWSALLP
jgi:hypothetical protein